METRAKSVNTHSCREFLAQDMRAGCGNRRVCLMPPGTMKEAESNCRSSCARTLLFSRARLDEIVEIIRFPFDAHEMWIALATVVVDGYRLVVILVDDKKPDGL